MTDIFNPECPNCRLTLERLNKWMDHIGCTPKKYQRYDLLLDFVRRLSDCKFKNTSLSHIAKRAQDLLKEIGESNE